MKHVLPAIDANLAHLFIFIGVVLMVMLLKHAVTVAQLLPVYKVLLIMRCMCITSMSFDGLSFLSVRTFLLIGVSD